MDADLNYPTKVSEQKSAKDLGPAGRDTNVADPKALSFMGRSSIYTII